MFYKNLKAKAVGVAALCIAAVFAITSVNAATLDGSTIRATAAFPNIPGSTTAGPVDAVVGAGVEFSNGQFTPFFGPTFDFSGNTITITHTATGHSSGTFNGYIFNDLNDTLGDFTSLSVISDTTGFFSGDLSRLFFDAENLYVNFESLFFQTSSDQIVLGVGMGVSVVPIPATLPLFASGIAIFGLYGWRRKQKKAAAAA